MFDTQSGHGSIHVIDLRRSTMQQVLLHGSDVARRRECLIDLTHEIDIEGYALSCSHSDAFIDHQLLEPIESRLSNATDFATEHRRDWIDDAIEHRFVPDLGNDVRGNAAV